MNDQVVEQQGESSEANAAAKKQKAEVELVTLSDGTTAEFAGKRKMLKSSIIDGDKISVRLDFRNAETRTFVLPQELIARFAAHGAEQKLGDETAGENDVDDMVLAIDNLIDRLNKGEWSIQRQSGGMSGTSVLLQALVEFSGREKEQVKTFLSNKTPAEKRAMRADPKIKPIVDRIESEKASKESKIDTESLLASL